MATYSGTLTYGGKTLSNEYINNIIYWGNRYHVLPTGMICQMYLESHWGTLGAGSNPYLNNWGGITYVSDSQFPPDILYTRGTARPESEGGYYVRFASMNDYFHAHAWLIASEAYGGAGIYNVSDKPTVQLYSQGLFVYGGALYNYATDWQEYESTMLAIESGIKSSNPDFDTINSYAGSIGGTTSVFLFPPIANIVPEDITSPYGLRVDPFTGVSDWHSAVDLGGTCQEPIYASMEGIVSIREYPYPDCVDCGDSGGGNWIEITHPNNFKTRYLHLTSINVQLNEQVSKGQVIGTMGSTGYSTGCHLHYELWDMTKPLDPDGKNTIDPTPYLFNNIPIWVINRTKSFKWWLYMKRRI